MTDLPWCGVLHCSTDPGGAAAVWASLIGLLAAGIAVWGAVKVGLRQAEILHRQSLIGERMANLEELKLKSELFDDRFEVYESTREWLRFIVGEARPPRDNYDSVEGEAALLHRFLHEWDRSRFLFRPAVHAKLRQLLNDSHRLYYHQRVHQKADADREEFQDNIAKEYEILRMFEATAEDMKSIFGDELTLSPDDQPIDGTVGQTTDEGEPKV